MSARVVGSEQAWSRAQRHGGPAAVGFEGRGHPGRPAGRVRWPASRCAGAEPGRAAGRRGTSLGKSGRYFVAPSRPIARRRRTSAAHFRISAVGASDAPTDRTGRRLNPHNDLSPARMPAAVKRFFSETEALVRHVPDRDGSPMWDWQLTVPRLSTSKRCCESGRRGVRSRPAWPASNRVSREGASSATRVITPVGKADRAAASSPGSRCRAADRELGKYPPFRSAAEEPPTGVPGSKGGTH
jgi:hypothetical protein